MIALVKTVIDRKTGIVISKKIEKKIDMTKDEYYDPIVKLFSQDIISNINKKKLKETD